MYYFEAFFEIFTKFTIFYGCLTSYKVSNKSLARFFVENPFCTDRRTYGQD